jgi:hypothetical protein
MSHQKWEYHEETLHFKGEKTRLLWELGQKGWELCGIMNDAYATAYFKRPLLPPKRKAVKNKKA